MLLEKKKKDTFVAEKAQTGLGRDARVVEEARLESVYTPKAYPGFESPSLRRNEREMRSKYNNNNQLINLKN